MSMATSTREGSLGVAQVVGQAETRRQITDFVRRRVADHDVEDVVQTVLVEALASDKAPEGETEIRKWLVGIARHKVADLHRRGGRERPAPADLPELEAEPAPLEERELARWAEEQAGSSRDATRTLAWMAREGEGDKLEHIAAEENVPPARIRQRVSRMRRWMKDRWLAELALVAALGALVFWLYRATKDDPIVADPSIDPSTLERGRALRAEALGSCERGEHQKCLDGLDEAKRLDPAGDAAPTVERARQAASDALRAPEKKSVPQKSLPPAPTDEQKVAPTSSVAPPTRTAVPTAAPPSTTPAPDPTGETKPAPFTKAPSKPSPKTTSEFDGSSTFDLGSKGGTSAPPSKKKSAPTFLK